MKVPLTVFLANIFAAQGSIEGLWFPEIIELDISNISEDYLKFIKENTI